MCFRNSVARVCGFECKRGIELPRGFRARLKDGGKSRDARVDGRAAVDDDAVLQGLEEDPGSGVRAFVQLIIDQPGVTAQGNPAARGAEVSFRAGRVLLIAQVVSHIGECLHERDAEIGWGDALAPAGNEHREAVQHGLRESFEVLGQIVDVGCRRQIPEDSKHAIGSAVARGVAARLERDFDAGELRIEAIRGIGGGGVRDQGEGIRGEIAGGLQKDGDRARGIRGGGDDAGGIHDRRSRPVTLIWAGVRATACARLLRR